MVFVTSCSALRNLAGLQHHQMASSYKNLTQLTTNLHPRAIINPSAIFQTSSNFNFSLLSNFPISFEICSILPRARKKKKKNSNTFQKWIEFFLRARAIVENRRKTFEIKRYAKSSTEEASGWSIHRLSEAKCQKLRENEKAATEASLIQINRPRFARGRFLRLDWEGSKRR